MPRRDSNDSDTRRRKPRCKSASEISRNIKNFETWATYQGCEDVAFQDVPKSFKNAVKTVFDVKAQLPREWLDKSSDVHRCMVSMLPADFVQFIHLVGDASPRMFTSQLLADDCKELLQDIQVVFSAWKRLQKMRDSSRKWSEADYVANVYNVFRSPAVHRGDYRAQCSVSLAQPLPQFTMAQKDVRVLNAKTVSPDCAIFVPARMLRELSHEARSPYKILKNHSHRAQSGDSVGGESSFRFQSTICSKLPDTPAFEFASTFWEDKKPMNHLLEDAYRQNRMATTAAVRQLHSLHIQAPVFGLIWAQGTVRAHVDWWTVHPKTGHPSVQSAAYPGPKPAGRRTSDIFHEWNLEAPSDILQVYLLVRNLDRWTTGGFCDRIIAGIKRLVNDVLHEGHKIVPWRRKGDLGRAPSTSGSVHDNRPTPSLTSSDSPPKKKRRRKSVHENRPTVSPSDSPPKRKRRRRIAS